MKKYQLLLISCAFAVTQLQAQSHESPDHTFRNPILAGFYPDPSICRAGDDYYLVNSTFAYFPGIPVFHSKDMVNWRQIGNVMDRNEQMELAGLQISRGIFAPAITFHDGLFYVVCTLVDAGGNFVVTATDPSGPWSNPYWLRDVSGIDPSLFFDDDGQGYIVYNSEPPQNKPLYNGHRSIKLIRFDKEKMTTIGEPRIIVNGGTDLDKQPVWIEAPHVYKLNGWYYLLAAEGGTSWDHSAVIFRSKQVEGPYVSCEDNPILTQRHLDWDRKNPIACTGHADMVQTVSGEWWAVFLGTRPYEGRHFNTGRETFLAPVKWKDGWPVINPDFEEVQYTCPMPETKNKSVSPIPLSGNFTHREEFKDSLEQGWLFLRNPRAEWYTVENGMLAMNLRPETISGKMNPSFIGKRQTHHYGYAAAEMDFNPESENEKAGIAIFQNESHHYFFCKSIAADGHSVIQLYRAGENEDELIGEKRIPGREQGKIRLKIVSNGSTYDFLYSLGFTDWTPWESGVGATFLSTETAGGFVGCVYGLYATSNGQDSNNLARFNWFEYANNEPLFRGAK